MGNWFKSTPRKQEDIEETHITVPYEEYPANWYFVRDDVTQARVPVTHDMQNMLEASDKFSPITLNVDGYAQATLATLYKKSPTFVRHPWKNVAQPL